MHRTISLAAVIALASGCSLKAGLLSGSPVQRPAPSSAAAPSPAAANGRPRLAAAPALPADGSKPGWCKKERYESSSLDSLRRRFEDPAKRYDFKSFLDLNRSLCNEWDDDAFRREALSMRQTIMGELGLREADLAGIDAAMAMSLREGTIGYQIAMPPASPNREKLMHRGKHWQLSYAREVSPFFQAEAVAAAFGSGNFWSGIWTADALGDELSEHSKMFLINELRRSDLQVAVSLIDARSLDRKRFWKELEDPNIAPDIRIDAMFKFAALQRRMAERDKELAARAKGDAGLRQLFFSMPEKVAAQWREIGRRHRDLVTLARDAEFGYLTGSRKATAGCGTRAAALIRRVARGIERPSPDAYHFGLARTPLGFLAAVAGSYCDNGPLAGMGRSFAAELAGADELRRGPRTALIAEIIERAGALQFDDRDYDLARQIPRDRYKALRARGLAGSTTGVGLGGLVEATRRRGAKVEIRFAATVMSWPVCERSRPSRDKWRYNPQNHTIERVYECVKYGTMRKKSRQEPIAVPAEQARKVKKGRFVQFLRGKGGRDAVLAVWNNPQRKRLIRLYLADRG